NKNGREFTKAVCLILSAVFLLLSVSCAKTPKEYDFISADLSGNVSLYNKEITYEELLDAYKKEFEKNVFEENDFIPEKGGKIDFYLTAYLYGDEGYVRYEPFCRDTEGEPVKDYLLWSNSENSAFDNCLLYDISSSGENAYTSRIISLGSVFAFTVDIGVNNTNSDIAGKRMRFVVTPLKYNHPFANEADVSYYIDDFFADAKNEKDTVSYGDSVLIAVIAKKDGDVLVSESGRVIKVGEGDIFPWFDPYLIGISSGGTSNFSVSFEEGTFAEYDALYDANGGTVFFYVTVYKIFDGEKYISENSDFENLKTLKEHFRLRIFAENHLFYEVFNNSKITSYPKGTYKWMKAQAEVYVDDVLDYYSKYLEKLLGEKQTDDFVLKYTETNYFGFEEYIDKKSLIDSITKENLDYIIIINALADELGIEYSESDYIKDVLSYGDDISELEGSVLGGKQGLYADFLSSHIANKLYENVQATK
ncbi:MAG: hypothetical protein ACI4QR_04780, partial [Eubacteriales bacterium]